MTKVAVLDDWQDVARKSADWTILSDQAEVIFFPDAFPGEDDAAEALHDFDIILTMRERTPFPESLIFRLPKVRMIGVTGIAHRTLDLEACNRRGITVCNTGHAMGAHYATAELALGLLLSAARAIPKADETMRKGGFQRGVPVGIGLEGKTLGIMGLGRLGSRMARYGAVLEMDVIAWSPNLTEARARENGARLVSKQALFETSDAISLHMVLSDTTRGIAGADDIARMKQDAILVNTSRGPLVDEAALLAAVQAGKIIAALDVYDTEPLPQDHPLRSADRCVLTPHIGYSVAETWNEWYPLSVENALCFLNGKPVRVVSAV